MSVREKIAFVVQRYGEDFSGGAEYHCRQLALQLQDVFEVDVLTTCARSTEPFDNHFEKGELKDRGLRLVRFEVEGLDKAEPEEVLAQVANFHIEEDHQMMKRRGPYCPSLIRYLIQDGQKYKAIIFVTSLFYTTVVGIMLDLCNSLLLPTAHDEPDMYRHIYDVVFSKAKGILFNSLEERAFIEKRFPEARNVPSLMTCVGIEEFCHMGHAKECFLLYVGRVCNGKDCNRLVRYFSEYKKKNPSVLKLYIAGSIEPTYHEMYCKDVIYLGFISEERKREMMEKALLFMVPSKYESLSLVLLESLSAGTPVIVNEDCAVLKGQCVRSKAGLYYSSYSEFSAVLDYIIANPSVYGEMRRNGMDFVKRGYNWQDVTARVEEFIREF